MLLVLVLLFLIFTNVFLRKKTKKKLLPFGEESIWLLQ